MLMGHGCAVTIIDKKPAQIEFSSQFDVKVYYGDGTRVDLLRRAGAAKAQIIAFCIDGDGLDAQALGPVLEAFPPAAVFVRAYDRRHLLRLGSLDLAGGVREDLASAFCLGTKEIRILGGPEGRREKGARGE